MYEQLLKLEAHELARKSSVSWERIMEIRHLKDRMIRKCQRLVKPGPNERRVSRGDPFTFQTLVAPSDFRLKEMEKWFRDQHKRLPSVQASGGPKPSSLRQIAQPPTPQSQSRPTPSKAPTLLLRSTTYVTPTIRERQPSSFKPTSHPAQISRTERSISLPTNPSAARVTITPNIPTAVLSPLPLPVLLLAQRGHYGLDSPPEFPSERPAPLLPEVPNGDLEDTPSGTPSPEGNGEGAKSLRRKRSCIKRSSMSELVKSVSWADGQDLSRQLQHFTSVASHAQSSGTCTIYHHSPLSSSSVLNL